MTELCKAESDIIAVTFVDGVKYKARIEQFEQTAYVAVWGGGKDIDATIPVPDALAVMVSVGQGEQVEGLRPAALRVLREAAAVFAVTGVSRERATWGYRHSTSAS